MSFSGRLPAIRTLRRLAELDGPFPIKNRHVVLAAERFWFGSDVIDFLQLFPRDEVFHSRDEFIERCKQLKLFIREARHMPVETLRSPQE